LDAGEPALRYGGFIETRAVNKRIFKNAQAIRLGMLQRRTAMSFAPVRTPAAAAMTGHEAQQVECANAAKLPPVVFVHGLWLLPSSWDRWAKVFEDAGYTALAPSWPDDPETVEAANLHPEVFAHKSIGQIADHVHGVIARLNRKPVLIGHSFGGLLVQILAGRGLAEATVAIDPAPFAACSRFRSRR